MKLSAMIWVVGIFLVGTMAAATGMKLFAFWQFWVVVLLLGAGGFIVRKRLSDLD